MRNVFTRGQCQKMDWNVAQNTLPLFVKLLTISQLQTCLLSGFVYSIGSLTESLVKSANQSFLRQLQLLKKSSDDASHSIVHDLIEKLLNLCRTHLKNDRLSSSLIKTIDLIVQNGFLNDDTLKKYRIEFLNLFLENVRVSKNVQKLNAYVDFFCDMLQFESTENEVKENRVRERAMIQLMIMLCHQYPIVRKTTASKLFECIMSYPDIFDKEEENDECVTLLVDTVWDEPVVNLRPIRNRICDLTKTPKPVMKKTETSTGTS
jgi:tubulin-specific chaperone D